jgi:hypothetical protein
MRHDVVSGVRHEEIHMSYSAPRDCGQGNGGSKNSCIGKCVFRMVGRARGLDMPNVCDLLLCALIFSRHVSFETHPSVNTMREEWVTLHELGVWYCVMLL